MPCRSSNALRPRPIPARRDRPASARPWPCWPGNRSRRRRWRRRGRGWPRWRTEPDPAEAARRYRELIGLRPDSIWAQTALSRLAILEIYALDPGRPPAERLARAERLVPLARGPEAQGELHWLLAEAIFFYKLPPLPALPHLLAAERGGRLDAVTHADVLVQIATLSTQAGDLAQARTYYRKLLDTYPRDQRGYMVKRKLAELDAHP